MPDKFEADNAPLRTERTFSASPASVFAAFEDAAQFATWWGPNGFTNTFDQFEFREGGRWVFTMHGPNGANFANECMFRELVPASRIVIDHAVKPLYLLTVTLTPNGEGTHLSWVQDFGSPDKNANMLALSGTANRQVLDRLEAVLSGDTR